MLTNVYFRRLKINHDTHEFGTVANSYIECCSITKMLGQKDKILQKYKKIK
jgi:hypothetical protein